MYKKLLLSLVACVVLFSGAVHAENAGKTNTSTSQDSVNFDKYLVMDAKANVPNAQFAFTIAAGSAVDATTDSPEIFAGVHPEDISISIDAFSPSDTASTTVAQGDTVTLQTGEKYAKKVATIDFSDVEFTEPGIYRYVITETTPTEQGITIADGATRILDVYVESDDNGVLSITENILHKNASEVGKQDTSEVYPTNSKGVGFRNDYETIDISLMKTVTGNQANREKYFMFTVDITGAEAGTVYTVDLSGAEVSVSVDGQSKVNASSLTVGSDGSVSSVYYLKDTQYIKILGLTRDTSYNVTETIEDKKGYTVSTKVTSEELEAPQFSDEIRVPEGYTEGKTIGATDVSATADTMSVYFNNYRNGTVSTGYFETYRDYIIIISVVLLAIIALVSVGIVMRKRNARG